MKIMTSDLQRSANIPLVSHAATAIGGLVRWETLAAASAVPAVAAPFDAVEEEEDCVHGPRSKRNLVGNGCMVGEVSSHINSYTDSSSNIIPSPWLVAILELNDLELTPSE